MNLKMNLNPSNEKNQANNKSHFHFFHKKFHNFFEGRKKFFWSAEI